MPARLAASFVLSLSLTAALTFVLIHVCKRNGWISKPRVDRWHAGAPACFGGVAIWLGFVGASLAVLPRVNLWTFIGATSLMFAVGLIDDTRHLRPGPKLLAQVGVAAAVVAVCPVFTGGAVNAGWWILWLVGITNAFNLVDNMDGLSSGIALIACAALLPAFVVSGEGVMASVISLLAGALAGFLMFNFQPARIFMGDCGSLFLGCVMGTLSLAPRNDMPGKVAVATIILAVPIVDMFLVSVTRRLRGQAISCGGTDHSSHRLVRLGASERAAVAMLYGLAAMSGVVGVIAQRLSPAGAIATMLLWVTLLTAAGLKLFSYSPHAERAAQPGRRQTETQSAD